MSKMIHELKQGGEIFYPKTTSDAVTVGEQTLTQVLASINSGEGVNFQALIQLLDNKYLSKITADQASEVITFLKGIKGDNSTWSIGYDNQGNSIMEVDKLLVRMEAIYRELVVEKLSHVGGARIVSPASMKCSSVVEFDGYFRCYFDRGDRGEVVQQFEVDDQARCQTFDGSKMKYYWRLVVGVGDDYIDLSKSDCDRANTPTLTTLWSHTDIPESTEARDAVGINKEIYVKRAAGRLVKYDKYGLTDKLFEDTLGISVTNDDAGNLIINNYPYLSDNYTKSLKVLKKDGSEVVDILFSLPNKEVVQYLSPIKGDILSGIATFYIWSNGRKVIYKINFLDGEQVNVNMIPTSTVGDYTSEAYAIGDNGKIVTHTRGNGYIAINDGLGNETIIKAHTINGTAGSAAFIMGGVRYIVYNSGVNYADGFTIANMDNGKVIVVQAPLTNPTAAVNNSYSNRLSVQVINDTRAYIYCYTPGAMVAMYLLVLPETPAAGDDIVQCGNRTNVDRQNCIIETSYGTVSYIQYAGINSYSLAGKDVTVLSPSGNKFVGSFEFSSGSDVNSAINSVANNVAALNTDIAGVNETIVAQETRIAANESAITLQAAEITGLGSSISEIDLRADGIELSVNLLEDDLIETGIDIVNQCITVTADNFKVQNNDGEETFTVFEDGKIKSELIETNAITAKKVKTSDDGKRVEIAENAMTMYNADGAMRLLVSGDDIGDISKSDDNIVIEDVTESGNGASWIIKDGEFTSFQILESNNLVIIPAITVTINVTGDTGVGFPMKVQLYLDGEEYYGEIETSTIIPNHTKRMSVGNHTLTYSINGVGGTVTSYVVDLSTNSNDLVIKYPSELLQLCNNGIAGTFGAGTLKVTDDGVLLGCGNNLIRLSSQGIEKSTNGGQSWSSI